MKDEQVIEFVKWVVKKNLRMTRSVMGNRGIAPSKSYAKLLEEFKYCKPSKK